MLINFCKETLKSIGQESLFLCYEAKRVYFIYDSFAPRLHNLNAFKTIQSKLLLVIDIKLLTSMAAFNVELFVDKVPPPEWHTHQIIGSTAIKVKEEGNKGTDL